MNFTKAECELILACLEMTIDQLREDYANAKHPTSRALIEMSRQQVSDMWTKFTEYARDQLAPDESAS